MFSTKSLIEAVTTTSLEVQSSSPVDVHITSLLLLPQVKHCFQLLLSFIPCVEFLFTYESDFLVSVRAHQSQAQAWEQCVGIVPSSKHLEAVVTWQLANSNLKPSGPKFASITTQPPSSPSPYLVLLFLHFLHCILHSMQFLPVQCSAAAAAKCQKN